MRSLRCDIWIRWPLWVFITSEQGSPFNERSSLDCRRWDKMFNDPLSVSLSQSSRGVGSEESTRVTEPSSSALARRALRSAGVDSRSFLDELFWPGPALRGGIRCYLCWDYRRWIMIWWVRFCGSSGGSERHFTALTPHKQWDTHHYEWIQAKGPAQRGELAELLVAWGPDVWAMLNKLREHGQVHVEGHGRGAYWTLGTEPR
jgi:hypothetical protein